MKFDKDGKIEPDYGAGLQRNLDKIALQNQLNVEAQMRAENARLRDGLSQMDVASSNLGTELNRADEDFNDVESFKIDQKYGGKRNSDIAFLPGQMKDNMLELHKDGLNFSMRSSPVGKQGRKSNSKPKNKSKQEEFPRMNTRKLSKNADLKKE